MGTGTVSKQEALKLLDILGEDFDMLADGAWVPDKHSVEASQEVISVIRQYITDMEV